MQGPENQVYAEKLPMETQKNFFDACRGMCFDVIIEQDLKNEDWQYHSGERQHIRHHITFALGAVGVSSKMIFASLYMYVYELR